MVQEHPLQPTLVLAHHRAAWSFPAVVLNSLPAERAMPPGSNLEILTPLLPTEKVHGEVRTDGWAGSGISQLVGGDTCYAMNLSKSSGLVRMRN